MHAHRFVLVPLVFFFVGSLLPANDWTRFRGVNGTGIVSDKKVPLQWTDDDLLFKVKLPGMGRSSPIVVKDRVFLLSASETERLILCHDANSGKKLWSKSIPGTVVKIRHESSMASATPCSDGENVFVVFWDGRNVGLYAYDFAGKMLWSRDLGRFTSQHGPGFSPIVVDGKVIVNNDQDGSATLQAFDARTGKPRWEVKRKAFRACYSTPFIHEQGRTRELIVTTTAGITGYTLEGKQMWHYTWRFPDMPLRTVGSSIIADGHVFACAGDGRGDRNMIGVKMGGKGDVSATHLAWQKAAGVPYVPTLVAHQGHLYGVLDNGTAVCYETKSGKDVWQSRLSWKVSSSPLLIDSKVLVIDERGDAFVFAASPDGLKVLSRSKLGEPIFATPAIVKGKMYIRGDNHLFCIGK